jgi:hemolysin-activating ACP:hemolysin acyltransferase
MNDQSGDLAGTQSRSNSEVLGEILWLYANSPLHQRLKLFEVEQYVMPAIKHQRYRIYKRNGTPVGYVGIARLAKEVEDAWLYNKYVLQPDDWVSGDRLWILQFVVPFGDTLAVRKKLWYEPELIGKPIWAQRPNRNGPGVHVVEFGKYRYRNRKSQHAAETDGSDLLSEPQSIDGSPGGEQPAMLPGHLPSLG